MVEFVSEETVISPEEVTEDPEMYALTSFLILLFDADAPADTAPPPPAPPAPENPTPPEFAMTSELSFAVIVMGHPFFVETVLPFVM